MLSEGCVVTLECGMDHIIRCRVDATAPANPQPRKEQYELQERTAVPR